MTWWKNLLVCCCKKTGHRGCTEGYVEESVVCTVWLHVTYHRTILDSEQSLQRPELPRPRSKQSTCKRAKWPERKLSAKMQWVYVVYLKHEFTTVNQLTSKIIKSSDSWYPMMSRAKVCRQSGMGKKGALGEAGQDDPRMSDAGWKCRGLQI